MYRACSGPKTGLDLRKACRANHAPTQIMAKNPDGGLSGFVAGCVESVAEARRMQVEAARLYPATACLRSSAAVSGCQSIVTKPGCRATRSSHSRTEGNAPRSKSH